MEQIEGLSLLSSYVNVDDIIKVEFTPLLYIVGECGTEHRSANISVVTSFVYFCELYIHIRKTFEVKILQVLA